MADRQPVDRPILFSAPMVRALLAGRKTQTRRVVKPQPTVQHWQAIQAMHGRSPEGVPFGDTRQWRVVGPDYPDSSADDIWCRYGGPGDRLWVRETFLTRGDGAITCYRADANRVEAAGFGAMYGGWKPAIFMPRARSRITLEIIDARVQRLQDVTRLDIAAEGWPMNESQERQVTVVRELGWSDDHIDDGAIEWYADLWDAINGKGAWDQNPWVWALTFRRVEAQVHGF